jgi:hypothetical protein
MSRNGGIVSVVSGVQPAAPWCETKETSRDIAAKHRTGKSLADVAQRGALHGD